MAANFLNIAITNSVRHAEKKYYGRSPFVADAPGPDALTDGEISFVQSRDSFYMATVNEAGWPYIQHRGGPRGFLRVISPTELAFADFKGNRQLISTGNVTANDRVALFLMDYPQQTRLKILGHARVEDARDHPEVIAQLATPATQGGVERLYFIDVVAFDWNCPQHITPRYTAEEIEELVAPLRRRIGELEAALRESKR